MSTNDVHSVEWLMDWYKSQCNQDWEHQYGVRIETLDNPGWLLQVDLTDTIYENYNVMQKKILHSDIDWISFEIKGGQFRAYGGPLNLIEMIAAFAEVISSYDTRD